MSSSTICKMRTILYFAFVLLYGSAIAEDSMLQLDFTDTIVTYQHGNYYYSAKGGNVSLRCKYSNDRHNFPLSFNKGIRAENTSCIYSGGMLRTVPPGKYSVKKELDLTLLNIYSVDEDDCSLYACWYSQKINTTYVRTLFNFVYLHVLRTNEKPSFCVLNQNTSGVFHSQDDLVLRCPMVDGLGIKFNSTDGPVTIEKINTNCESLDNHFCKMNVTKVTSALNGTRISCTKSSEGTLYDFCRHIPILTVIDNLVVDVEVEGRQSRERKFALLTCTSFPSLLSRVQWYVESSNLMILSDTGKFNQLRIANRTFPNATKINFKVTCKITIGKISNSTTVNINYTFDSLVPSRGVRTTGSSNIGLLMTTNALRLKTKETSIAGSDVTILKTQTTNFTSNVTPLSPRSLSLASIIVPATVVPILVIAFILLIYCFRPSKTATVKRDSSVGGTDNSTRDNHYEDNRNRIQLGLSLENSQVAENVLYEPSKTATVKMVKRDSSVGGTDNLARDNHYEDKHNRIQLGLFLENSQVAENVLYEPYRGNII